MDTKNPDRGPLLIIDGEKDHTVPWAIANAAYKRQRRNPAVTEIVKMPVSCHSLTIDHGWREVAQTALDFVKRFVKEEWFFLAPTEVRMPLVDSLRSRRFATRGWLLTGPDRRRSLTGKDLDGTELR